MKVTLVIDGERLDAVVDPVAGLIAIGERRWPYRLLATTRDGATVEVAGETVTISGWPFEEPSPAKPVTAAGELVQVRVDAAAGSGFVSTPAGAPAPGAAAPARAGTIVPPMPGRILEVRVAEGQAVAANDVLLVLEAMKMRNELRAPHAGTVRHLRVRPGDSVRANEPMLEIEPAGT